MMDTHQLQRMANSSNAEDRLACLAYAREQLAREDVSLKRELFDLAKGLVADSDNDCRWQAIIILGEFIPELHGEVWQVICEQSKSADDDMIDALATVLLEHLLEQHFDTYYPLVKERINDDTIRIGDVLMRCWQCGQDDERWGEVLKLIDVAKNSSKREA